ncbi:tail completion and sheath stabilizer [Synechococcus phage S-CRM01]|uniref:tail completion and sheath stabilizer n=1 Tax=Synechococcus phage S-CRM01 TaxID=1026955 RepID=UPI000209E357|nr:tail completion and sheath stabilizer [Synechococcus phage S-CRM01]AEC52992.1 tail completion and sheath stabilizer [Synechococcus phage S-CRM01]
MAVQSDSSSLPPRSQTVGIENRNFLSPIGFKFTINRLKGVDFFCQSATVPGISMGAPSTGTRFNKIYHPGDELEYDELYIKFLVDENMKNYIQVHDWMREITTPYSSSEFAFNRSAIQSQNPIRRRVEEPPSLLDNQWKSDCSLFVLSSNYAPVAEFVFRDAFPVALTPLNFDSSIEDVNYFTSEIRIRYNYFDPYVCRAATATDSSMKTDYYTSEKGVDLDVG